MSTEFSEIASKIIKIYEANLFRMPYKYQNHWSTRMYRITGEEKYKISVLSSFQLRALRTLLKLSDLKNERVSINEIGLKMLRSYKPTTQKKMVRYKVYEKNPAVLFYINLVHFLFSIKSYGLEKYPELKVLFDYGMDLVKGLDVENVILDEDLILTNPSTVANSVYYLDFLGVGKHELDLIDKYKTIWEKFEGGDKEGWKNRIYALTHVVIAESMFYQRYATSSKYQWIFKIFSNEIDKIIEMTNPDITAEVGMCFKLAKVENEELLGKVKKIIASKFDENLGYIPRENENTMERAEHRNILAVMLLTDFDKLYTGPEFDKNELEFFIPQEGKFLGREQIED